MTNDEETESSKEYEQYAIAKRPPDDIGRIYLGLGSNPDKRYGYWIGRMVQRDYQDAEVVCAKRESRLAALDDCETLFKESFIRELEKIEFRCVACQGEYDGIIEVEWNNDYKALKAKVLAELEALRKKVEK